MKLKRLFTAILSAALTLSLCAMPAMADDGSTTGGTTGATRADGTPVWSKTTGSITIHKYEYNGLDKPDGTGVDNQKVPTGAKALGEVTFEIYKVQDEAWLRSYYGGGTADTAGKLSVTDYCTIGSGGKITVKEPFTTTLVRTITTDANTGIAKTTPDLDLGLYLVVETKVPDKVTARADPFLVSVPMTRIADSTDTNALTDWIYDVHVYPKNRTTYGQVTIEKKGYTGGRLDGALSGVEFALEKASTAADGTETWNPVTKRDDTGVVYPPLKTGVDGKIEIDGLSQGKYRIYENAYTTPNGYILDAAYHTFTVDKDGKITVGGIPATTIEVANHRPDMKKEVKNGDSWAQDAQYGVGDTVPYKITIDVPKNIDKLTTFTVTDTPTGLTDDKNSIAVKQADSTGEPTGSNLDSIYTATENGNGFTITFTPSGMTAYAGEKLVITYNAIVKDTAVVGGNGNLNNAKLEYTNKINSDNTTESTTYTIEDSAVMYSFGIKVRKTKEDGIAPLQGVVFDLYREAKTGETSAITGDDAEKVGLARDKSWFRVKSGLITDAKGIIDTSASGTTNYIGGLAYGDYYLVETKTAESYNLLTKPVEVNLYVTANVQWKTNETFDEHGKLTKRTVETTTFTNANADSTNPALVVAKVINRKGFTLPVTGGFGTLLFSGIGLLLVLVGVSVLFSLKKKTNRA